MSDVPYVLKVLRLALFALIVVSAVVYGVPILFLRRFHQPNHLLTLNFCIASFNFGIHYLVSYIIHEIDRTRLYSIHTCSLFMYSQMATVAQVVLALLMISINRCCSVIYYTNPFFKTKRWVLICLVSQWTLGFVIVLPLYRRDRTLPFCAVERWLTIYIVTVIVIAPSIVSFVVNAILFKYVYLFSRRIHQVPRISHISCPTTYISRIRRQDIYLLRHAIFMFIMFMGGWGPINILGLIQTYSGRSYRLYYALLVIWTEICLLGDMVNLFFYNHELRHYLKRKLEIFLIDHCHLEK